ncbi:MAG: hypothetical protein QW534_07085 [Candidatus Methanomethylicia archaeon]
MFTSILTPVLESQEIYISEDLTWWRLYNRFDSNPTNITDNVNDPYFDSWYDVATDGKTIFCVGFWDYYWDSNWVYGRHLMTLYDLKGNVLKSHVWYPPVGFWGTGRRGARGLEAYFDSQYYYAIGIVCEEINPPGGWTVIDKDVYVLKYTSSGSLVYSYVSNDGDYAFQCRDNYGNYALGSRIRHNYCEAMVKVGSDIYVAGYGSIEVFNCLNHYIYDVGIINRIRDYGSYAGHVSSIEAINARFLGIASDGVYIYVSGWMPDGNGKIGYIGCYTRDLSLVWCKTLSFTTELFEVRYSNGFLYVCGYVSDSSGMSDAVLVKLDRNGEVVWWRRYGLPNSNEWFRSLAVGEYIYVTGGGRGGTYYRYVWETQQQDFLMLIVDKNNGAVVWEDSWGGSGWELGEEIALISIYGVESPIVVGGMESCMRSRECYIVAYWSPIKTPTKHRRLILAPYTGEYISELSSKFLPYEFIGGDVSYWIKLPVKTIDGATKINGFAIHWVNVTMHGSDCTGWIIFPNSTVYPGLRNIPNSISLIFNTTCYGAEIIDGEAIQKIIVGIPLNTTGRLSVAYIDDYGILHLAGGYGKLDKGVRLIASNSTGTYILSFLIKSDVYEYINNGCYIKSKVYFLNFTRPFTVMSAKLNYTVTHYDSHVEINFTPIWLDNGEMILNRNFTVYLEELKLRSIFVNQTIIKIPLEKLNVLGVVNGSITATLLHSPGNVIVNYEAAKIPYYDLALEVIYRNSSILILRVLRFNDLAPVDGVRVNLIADGIVVDEKTSNTDGLVIFTPLPSYMELKASLIPPKCSTIYNTLRYGNILIDSRE